MWYGLAKFFGFVEDVDEPEGSSVDGENVKSHVSREEKEAEGIVTNVFAAYGLIDSEIVFTKDVFVGEMLPLVGDKVLVKAWRDHIADAWRAIRVSKVLNCWEERTEWDFGENDHTSGYLNEEKEQHNAKRQEKIAAERLALEELLKEKFGVKVLGEDFGRLGVSLNKSINLKLKNQGSASQMLLRYYMSGSSQQMEMGPLKVSEINLKEKSKKVQEALPMIIEPGTTIDLVVICQTKHLGREDQTVIFEFSNFNIGKVISVDVTHPSVIDKAGEEVKFHKVNTMERMQNTRQQILNRNLVIIPGPKSSSSRNKRNNFKSKLPHYPVPEDLRDCVFNNKDVTRILPCLKRHLDPSTYEVRFSGLLHLEEIQQEIDMREFDMEEAQMEVKGEYLSLKIPGLLEGRPSLILGDRVIASKKDCPLAMNVSYEGVVYQIMSDAVLLKFCTQFHTNFETSYKYSMTFTFNRNTFRRCHMGVDIAAKFKDEILFPTKLALKPSLVDLVSSNQKANLVPITTSLGRKVGGCHTNMTKSRLIKFFNPLLNDRQQMAVVRILQGQARPTPYIIFGPPGTGKTITVVEAILQLQSHLPHARILACTPSNSAADLLAERLHESGRVPKSNMVRLYAALRPEETVPHILRSYCSFVDDSDLNLECKSVVVCTCSTAGGLHRNMRNEKFVAFTHIFVDEAGQATEPESMIAIALVMSSLGQVVLAGDPQQLGPVLRSNIAKDLGLQKSYLERLCSLPLYSRNEEKFFNMGGYDPLLITKLVDNYRSHRALICLPSCIFYHDELSVKADNELINCLNSWDELPNKDNFPLLFHGVRGEDMREGNSPSWFNPHEVVLAVKYLSSLLSNEKYKISPDDVGVITPYRKQVEKIRSMVDNFELPKVKIGSVEEFQGQERLAIIISTVRSSESLVELDLKFTLGFLGNPKRFNVAITRAHALLVVIGNPHVLCQDLYWSRLVRYCAENRAYIGCDLPSFSHGDDPFFENFVVPQKSSKTNENEEAQCLLGNSGASSRDEIKAFVNQVPRIASDDVSSDNLNLQPVEKPVTNYMKSTERKSEIDDLFDKDEEIVVEDRLKQKSGDALTSSLSELPSRNIKFDFAEPKHHSSPYPTTDMANTTSGSFSSIEKGRYQSNETSLTDIRDLLDRAMLEPHESLRGEEAESLAHLSVENDLHSKITRQVEYYFGDINLRKDRFLQEKISGSRDGWCDIETLLTFNKMKAFHTDIYTVAEVLCRYSSQVQVSQDRLKVRRNPAMPLEEDLEKWKMDVFGRSIVLRNYPTSECHDKMQSFFEFYGPISHVERSIPLKVWQNKHHYKIERCDLIIYCDLQSARSIAKHRYTRMKKMGLEIYFLDDVARDCINFFTSKKIENIQRNCIPFVEDIQRKQKSEHFTFKKEGDGWIFQPQSSESSGASCSTPYLEDVHSNGSGIPALMLSSKHLTGEHHSLTSAKDPPTRIPFKSTVSESSDDFHSEEIIQNSLDVFQSNATNHEDDDDVIILSSFEETNHFVESNFDI